MEFEEFTSPKAQELADLMAMQEALQTQLKLMTLVEETPYLAVTHEVWSMVLALMRSNRTSLESLLVQVKNTAKIIDNDEVNAAVDAVLNGD